MQHILLLHGALGSSTQLDDLKKALQPAFHVHCFSFTGHGRAASHHHAFTIQNFAHEVLQYLNEKQIQSIDIFGYSMGGYVALWLARFYPDRVGRIFTLGTKLKWNKEEAEREMKLLNADKVSEKVPDFAKSLAELHGEHEWKSVMHKTALMMNDLAHTHLEDQDFVKIEAPVMLTLGKEDKMVTAGETEYAQRLMKNAIITYFDGVQHPLSSIAPDRLAAEITAFISQ